MALGLAGAAAGEEGMWLFNEPPVEQVEEAYGFTIEPGWLDHLRESSLRFANGASGSFVSASGLILTNHHVGAGIIGELSTAEKDLMRDGFLARSPEEELRCGDLAVSVLESIRDVTAEVEAAVAEGMDEEAAMMARRAVIAELEAVAETEAGRVRREVVTLYRGGAYHLYESRIHDDVRLVFAPERKVAAFGGDPDNFEYPRHCLDFCFFRAWEGGRPARVKSHLKWSERPVEEGQLVFSSGHPGRTNRGLTHAEVRAMRDVNLPFDLRRLHQREVTLAAWAARDPENLRRVEGSLFGTRNGRKARRAMLERLLDPAFIEAHAAEEAAFRKSQAGTARVETAFREIEALVERRREAGPAGALFGGGRGFGGRLFDVALKLVSHAGERKKPDAERRAGHREADRVSLERNLFSAEPVYRDVEALLLADSLGFMCGELGADDPRVALALGGEAPGARARRLVAGSRLDDLEVRRALYEGGPEAIEASEDAMIVLAREMKEVISSYQDEWESEGVALRRCHGVIARARQVSGRGPGYPDATFSLRLSYGRVAGVAAEGMEIPYQTTIGGLFERADRFGGEEPFSLPPRWEEMSQRVDPEVSFNFISTNDITGGNSGSPLVDREGRLVGLVFDGNLGNLGNDVRYAETTGRCVSVSASGMLEALRSVYEARELVEELAPE